MTVVQPNSISGINSITVAANDSLSIHKSDGSLLREIVSNTGVSTFHAIEVSKGGADLTVGVSTFFVDNSAGKIGIGTIAPSKNLHIEATGHTQGILIHAGGNHSTGFDMDSNRSSAAGGLAEVNFKWDGTTVGQIGAYAGADTTNKDDGHLQFSTAPAGTLAERMRITSAGLVGIGQADPEGLLHIEASSSGASYTADAADTLILERNGGCVIDFRTPAANDAGLIFSDNSARAVGTLLYNHSDNSLAFGGNGAERMRIRGDGRVSIGSSLAVTGVCTAAAFIPEQGQLGNRNLIINGAMQVAQRGNTGTTTSGTYVPDRFRFWATGGTATFSISNVPASTPYDLGFRKYASLTNTSAASGATDYRIIRYQPEAQDIANSGWDYTDANSYITFSFWVRSSIAYAPYAYIHTMDGTAKAYIFSLGSLSANTWTKIEKTIPGGTGVEFDNNTGEGMRIDFVQFWGTDYTGTVNTDEWVTYSSSTRTPDMSNSWAVASGATFDITGVQLEVGAHATPFEHRSYADELTRCQRYYCRTDVLTGQNGAAYGKAYSTSEMFTTVCFPTSMRAAPTVTTYNNGGTAAGVHKLGNPDIDSISSIDRLDTRGFGRVNKTSAWATGDTDMYSFTWEASAEL